MDDVTLGRFLDEHREWSLGGISPNETIVVADAIAALVALLRDLEPLISAHISLHSKCDMCERARVLRARLRAILPRGDNDAVAQ